MPRPKPPPPSNPAEHALLNQLAEDMLAEAVSATEPRLFSATGFAKENISILHQQLRCTNLAWALEWKGYAAPGAVVGIVGGSFSGLTLAVALSLSSDAIVYIFEKQDRLLPRFLDKGHRHLSPVLNSRDLGHRFDPSFATPQFRSPIFAWTKGRASDVAAQWLHEFETYDRLLPIFVFKSFEVQPDKVVASATGLEIRPSGPHAKHLQPIKVDLLIDATGFGEEANPLDVVDSSYWEAGHRLIYDHLAAPAEVLVSGCGDSGLIEALHYALQGFRHEDVEALWPQPGPGPELDAELAGARLDYLLKTGNLEDCDALPEVSWWLEAWWYAPQGPAVNWLGLDPWRQPIFDKIEEVLDPELRKAFPSDDLADLDWFARRDFANELPWQVQSAVREAVRPLADDWISHNVAQVMSRFGLPPQVDELRRMARSGVTVMLNGRTPTPYTRQLSPYNVWLMSLLLSLPHVDYRQGKIEAVAWNQAERRFSVSFEGGSVEQFDRVVTRYGAGGGAGVATGARRDTQGGDWLLDQWRYLAHDPQNPGQKRYFWSARDTLEYALEDLQGPPPLLPPSDLSKNRYVARLLMGASAFPIDDPLHPDPEAPLRADLRGGRRRSFKSDALVERVLKR